jgi:hypothetical protein
MTPEPTDEGKKRYPACFTEAGYHYDYVFEKSYPCTCLETSEEPCHGTYHPGCGCKACGLIYGDFLSDE